MAKYDNVQVEIDLSGPDGNAFAVLAIVARALRAEGAPAEDVSAYHAQATGGNYEELIATTAGWVNFTDLSEEDYDDE